MLVAGLLGLTAGCGGPAPPGTRPAAVTAPAPAAVPLTVACGDPAFAEDFADWAKGRKGVAVTVVPKPPADVPAADIALVRPSEVGDLAAAGALAPLPAGVRSPTNPARHAEILEVYRETLAGWAGTAVGLPLAGDGYVLAYRADRLTDPKHRDGLRQQFPGTRLPPATWDDVLAAAEYFSAADGKPALPPLPADPTRLLTEFHQLAACYDRPVRRAGAEAGVKDQLKERRVAGFHFDPDSGRPRLTAPGFAAALDWFARAQKFRPPADGGDPAAALADGSAVLAVLSLGDLARLPKGGPNGSVTPTVGLAPLPGSAYHFDAAGKRTAAAQPNAVPYLGAGGWVGVVLAAGQNQPAAWDLLAAAAGPDGSAARMAESAGLIGPYRLGHVEKSAVWLDYLFDNDRTVALTDALRRYVAADVSNPALVLRTPKQAELSAALADEVRAAARGQRPPAEALDRATAAWDKLSADTPPAKLREWRRAALGLQ